MKKVIIMTLLLPGLAGGLHAQFFKNLLNNVKNTAQNKVNNKASQTTDKAIDGVLQPGANKNTTSGTPANTPPAVDTAAISRVLGAFGGAAAANPNDTSAADLTMKALNRLAGGGQDISKADSAAAIKLFMTSQGGSGVCYEYTTSISSKSHGASKDTNAMYFTNSGEGRSEMRIPIPGMKNGKMIILGRIGHSQYSMNVNDDEKTYSLNVIDTALINSGINEYTATKVGEETVDGYHCMHARLVSKGAFGSSSNMDIWTSTAVPGYDLYKKLVGMSKITPGMTTALDKAGCNGYMVKMVSTGKDYSMTMELLKAQEKNLPASLFRIPSGYTESDDGIIGTMFKGAQKK